MQAAEAKVQKVLEGSKQFLVPHYQRPYSWGRQQWDVLWRDVMELTLEGQSTPHFLGSIVTAPAHSIPEGVEKRLLIDGQQRLTTLLVLLAQIRDRAKVQGNDKLAERIHDLITNRHDDGREHFKLLPTQSDNLAESDRDAFISLIENIQRDSTSAIAKAGKYFANLLHRTDCPAIDDLARTITSKLTLVSIILDEADNPHRIFESLNGKGRPLSQVDLIRNYFFMRIPNEDHDRVFREQWQPMQKLLGEAQLTEFVRHYLMHFGSSVVEADVYASLKDRIEKSSIPIGGHLQEIATYASYYKNIVQPERCSFKIREQLARINILEVTVSYPFLLPTYADFAKEALTEQQFSEVLDIVETFIVRRFVCGIATNGLGKIFTPLYQRAKRHVDFVTGVKEALPCPKDQDFAQHFVAARLYGQGDRREKVKLILQRIEGAFGHKERILTDAVSIEHVMPQTLTQSWKEELGDEWEDDHEELLHTIGNLTLTGYNSELSNDPYHVKKTVFAKSHLVLNNYFSNIDTWTAVEIERRAESLREIAFSIWPYFGTGSLKDTVETNPQEAPGREADDGSDDLEVRNVTGTIPSHVRFRTQVFDVRSWAEVLVTTFDQIAALGDDKFDIVANTLPRWITRDPTRIRRARRLKVLSNGAFIETNLSAMAIVRLCQQALRVASVDPSDWDIVSAPISNDLMEGDDDEDAETTQNAELGRLHVAFWEQLRAHLIGTGHFAALRAPRSQNSFGIAFGHSNFWLSLAISTQKRRVSVKLIVRADQSPTAMQRLLAQRVTIETQIGEALVWDTSPTKKHLPISLSHDIAIADRANWPAATEWLTKTVVAFRDVFTPLIEAE